MSVTESQRENHWATEREWGEEGEKQGFSFEGIVEFEGNKCFLINGGWNCEAMPRAAARGRGARCIGRCEIVVIRGAAFDRNFSGSGGKALVSLPNVVSNQVPREFLIHPTYRPCKSADL